MFGSATPQTKGMLIGLEENASLLRINKADALVGACCRAQDVGASPFSSNTPLLRDFFHVALATGGVGANRPGTLSELERKQWIGIRSKEEKILTFLFVDHKMNLRSNRFEFERKSMHSCFHTSRGYHYQM